MAKNFIVLRESPDWRSFDVDLSREFCRRAGIMETAIIDFVAIWDRTMKVDYRLFRHRVKEIALSNFSAVLNAKLISHHELRGMSIDANDRIAFTDDDDWFAPDLFDIPINEYGAYWGSLRLGRAFGSSIEKGRNGLLTFRPIDRIIYTNNYIVSGKALSELGFDALFGHSEAQKALTEKKFRPLKCNRYVSCANKTPASALSASYLLSLEDFRNNPSGEFIRFANMLNSFTVPASVPWMREPFERFRALVNEAVSRI